MSPVKVLGVDEWAWRKGQSYATILVDLEERKPIDLLADATAESFAAWLQAHPFEGQINRLKLIKRQAYGRAEFDLLRQRVLARSA